MGNVSTALTFVVILNVLMFLSQVAILDINPNGTNFYEHDGTLLVSADKNAGVGDPVIDTDGAASNLPAAKGSVSPTTGNIFTDIFNSVKSWFVDSTGLRYLGQIVSAPYSILKSMGLPSEFSFAIGGLWYLITFFLIISFIWGRD